MLRAFDFKRSAASTEKGSDLTDSKHSKTSWKKSDMKLCNYFELDSDSIGKNKKQNDKNSCASNKNSSTLSLHIAAYENFIETENENSVDASDTLKDLKKHGKSCLNMQILGSQTSADMMNPFEFPRQQEDKKYPESEISQFRASQRLFAPNQSNSSTQQQRVQAHQNNLQDPRNALTLGSNNDEVRRPPSATVSSELRNGERERFSVPSNNATIRQLLSASYHSNIPNVHRSVPTILGHQQLGRDRIQQLQRLPSISSLHMPSTPVNLKRNGNLQNSQHQLAIQKDVPQQIQQQQPPAAAASTSSVVQVQQKMTHQQDSESKFSRIMDIAEEIIAEPGYDPEQFAVQLQERCVNANLHGRHFYNSWVQYTANVHKRWEHNGFKFATAADQRFAVIKRQFDNSFCVSETAASNSASTPQHTVQASPNGTTSRPRRGTQPEYNGLSSNSNVRKDSRAVPENVTGQLTHSESSSNNNRATPKMAQHHQRRDAKFQAIMAVAEEIVGEADFEPEDFGSQLNQRCKNAGVQGTNFATSWYHFVEYAQKRWEENGNEFANVNDERFADIHRRLNASYCMPGQSSPHDTEDRSSNSNINEGNESSDRSNRRQRRAATPGPSSKRIRQNVSDPQESPQTNPPARQRLDFLLPPMNSRPVAPQFSNHERLQQIYIDRFFEQQREYDNRNSFPPRDGFHADHDHSSSMPRSETTAENEEQNGSGKESSTNSDMISASELENDEPQIQPDLDDVPVPAHPDSVSLSDPVENVETACAATENQEQHQITDIMARQINAMIQHSEIQTNALKDFMNMQVETLSKMNQK